ncbi:MAG: hypothetical protein CM15mP127_11540 [Gammaproteobacteria bacterium]|nr:MAG: hypothetical protein CM15mP127_11540 [Gammaproteobacteria bacterium]
MSYVHDERRADEAGEEPYSLWDGGYLYRFELNHIFHLVGTTISGQLESITKDGSYGRW